MTVKQNSKIDKTRIKKPKMNVAEIVTQQVIKGLEQGYIPWRKPWHSGMRPMNFLSKHEYQGVNIFMAELACEFGNYQYPLFASFKQIAEKGWKLRKGAKGHIVTFTKTYNKTVDVKDDSDNVIDTTTKHYSILRYYYVFNIGDIDPKSKGFKIKNYLPKANEVVINLNAMKLVKKRKPDIRYGGDRACYTPLLDYIQMPEQQWFAEQNEFYLTLFHELTHWTGHETRLNRDIRNLFGDHKYSKEELVAECGANMLAMLCGIENEVPANSIAYVQSWIKALQNDPKMVIHAAAQANKAVEFIKNGKLKAAKPSDNGTKPEATKIPVAAA